MNKGQLGNQTFGEFFRSKRISQGLTLRSFCDRFGYDPGNVSRLERNILSPTLDEKKLKGYAQALQIENESPEWVTFFDLAHVAKGTLPKDVLENQNVASLLPAFYRSARGTKLTKEKVEKLIQLLNQESVSSSESNPD